MLDHPSRVSSENDIALQKFGIGQPVRRKEDDTLVRGKGTYTDDISLPGQAYAWIVRSTHAHGVIKGIDTEAARAMPGVLGVWTGKDLASAGYNPFTVGLPMKSRDGSPLMQTNRLPLMTDKVRFVGDPVAFVVAETLAQARDAGESVVVDIEPLPSVTSAEDAAKPGAPLLYDHIPRNVVLVTTPRSMPRSQEQLTSPVSTSSTPASPWSRWSRARRLPATTKKPSASPSKSRRRASPATARRWQKP